MLVINFDVLAALDWQPVAVRMCCGRRLEVKRARHKGQILEYVECLNCGHFELWATNKEPIEIVYK